MRLPGKILHRYALREIAGPFVLSLLVLSVLFIFPVLFLEAGYLVGGALGFLDFMKLALLWMPFQAIYTVPMAFLFAILAGMGRISEDFEWEAIRAGGGKSSFLASPIVVFGLILSVGVLLVSDQVSPRALRVANRLFMEKALKNPLDALMPGVTYTLLKSDENYLALRFESKEAGELRGISMAIKRGKNLELIHAETGRFSPVLSGIGLKLDLAECAVVTPNFTGDPVFSVAQAIHHSMWISEDQFRAMSATGKKEKTIRMLLSETQDENRHDDQKEACRRLSLSWASLVFAVFAVPISLKRKESRGVAFGIAFGLLLIYYLVWMMMQGAGGSGFLATFGAYQVPNLLLGSAGLFILWRSDRF